ncbi:MAG: plasmid mobilization relaxosome protein MobC [Acidobacteria bacterium]|nr:plasmid mobilization relaxosome protein MobC [Acidobacteriota bacterium]
MGRPRLSVKRDQQFGIRLTDAEALAIAAAAGRRGMPPVAFIRSAALEAAGASVAAAPSEDSASTDAVERRSELRRIGSNLNQAVRRLHQGREDLAELRRLVEEVRDQVALEVAPR